MKTALCGLLGALATSACSSSHVGVGETHTIAPDTQMDSVDWPCFADRGDYRAWLASAGNDKRQDTIEQTAALWLEPGDSVKIVRVEPDAIEVRIVTSTTDEFGKICWTPSYHGALFSK
jgi:hypothetical protein